MTTTDSTIRVKVEDQTAVGLKSATDHLRDFTAAVGTVQGPLNGVTGRMSAFNMAATRSGFALAGVGVAVAGFTKVLYDSFSAGMEVERNQLRLEALIKATGKAAGYSAEEISNMAETLDKTTLASANGAREAAGALLTFRNISGETFKRTLGYAQDMVAVFGGDLRSSAVQLGKALEDPTTGLTALNRVGITFTDTEKDLIKNMQETGKVAEAQQLILQKLEEQIGGAGAGEAGGMAGAVDGLSFAWTKLLETFGKSTAGQNAIDFVNGLTTALSKVNEVMTPWEDRGVDDQIQRQIGLVQQAQQAYEHAAKFSWYYGESTVESAKKAAEASEHQLRWLAYIKASEEDAVVLADQNRTRIEEDKQKAADLLKAKKSAMEEEAHWSELAFQRKQQDNKDLETDEKLYLDRVLDAHRKATNLVIEEDKKKKKLEEESIKRDRLMEQSKKSLTNNSISLLRALGEENANFARLAIVIEKAQAIAGIIANAAKARLAALASHAGSTIAAAPAIAAIDAMATANIGAVAALGALELSSVGSGGGGGGGSSGGGGGGYAADPGDGLGPSSIPRAQVQEPLPPINIKIEMGGKILGEVVTEGLIIGQNNDMINIRTENSYERVIIG